VKYSSAVIQDLRYSLRALWCSRRFTGWVVGSLAIGMAVTIAALALLNASLILPFPQVADQHRLVRVSVSRNCGRPDCWSRMSLPADYDALREGLTGLQGLAAYATGNVAAAVPDARSMRALVTSPNYFAVLGVRPVAGRVFDTQDDGTDAAVAVIAYSAWQREFNGDPSVVGRTIRVADQFVHVIGVAPDGFIGIDRLRPGSRNPDIWLPMWMADRVLPFSAAEQRRQERDVAFVGRLKDNVQASQLRTETAVVGARLATARAGQPQTARAEVDRVWRVRPQSWHIGVIVVMPIPILVLVIACVNAANLMLARGSQRQREIATRLAIGASRRRIVRQLLIESGVLAVTATMIAVPVAWWSLQLASTPLNESIPLDPLVLTLTILTAAVTTVAFGLTPAIRLSAGQPSIALGPALGRSDALPPQARMRRILVAAQVALSLGLLATAWQLVATVRLQAVSAGTPGDQLLIARFDLQPLNLGPGQTDSFYRELLAGAARLPNAEAAGLARHSSVWTFGQAATQASVEVWRPSDGPDDGHLTIGGYAEGDLFDAIGLRLLSGRRFVEADRLSRPQVAIVNESAARLMTGPAVGGLIRIAPRAQDLNTAIEVRIVGVIEPAVEPRLEQNGPPAAKIYLPSPIEPEPALALYLRTRGPAIALAQPIRELVNRIAPRVPILEIGSLDELNERSYSTQLWLARAAAVLGMIGLLLATAGLYGVSSYVVAMRSREIAIRMAIGAQPREILRMILRQSLGMAAVGLLAGGGAALAVSQVIQSEYHGIQKIDPGAFGGAAALFIAAMLVASAIPAIRASRVDPVANLKDG
jgi:putative ABC transport system permease protein